jgi:hypothetical protein
LVIEKIILLIRPKKKGYEVRKTSGVCNKSIILKNEIVSLENLAADAILIKVDYIKG